MIPEWLGYFFVVLLLGSMCLVMILLIIGITKTICESIMEWFNL